MQLSRESQYALEGLSVLAEQPRGKVMLLREIAKVRHLPPGFLAKIFQKLTRHKVVSAHRGAIRGYSLARLPHEISLRAILEAVEGSDVFERCIFWAGGCSDQKPCRLHHMWAMVRPKVQEMMERTTLEEIVSGGVGGLSLGGQRRECVPWTKERA